MRESRRRRRFATRLAASRKLGALPSSHSRSEWWGGVGGGGLFKFRAASSVPPTLSLPTTRFARGGGDTGAAHMKFVAAQARRVKPAATAPRRTRPYRRASHP